MKKILSTKELAAEALRALEETRMTPLEHFEWLVRQGIIDRQGRVLVCRYFSGDWVPEGANAPPATPADPVNRGAESSLPSRSGSSTRESTNHIPSTKELAEEALRILRENPETPKEHLERLVQAGIIDREGRVLCNRYFGDGLPANGDSPPATPPEPPKDGP